MDRWIEYFREVVTTAFALYFRQETRFATIDAIPAPAPHLLLEEVGEPLDTDERLVLLLALMPHLSPKELDLFFVQNKGLDRPYTEFGGWKGQSHHGFLPTGATAAFILQKSEHGADATLYRMFSREHPFARRNILHLAGQGPGEPFLSGRLAVAPEFLDKIIAGDVYDAAYQADF